MPRYLLMLLLLAVPGLLQAQAMSAMFYQPQLRDRTVSDAQWSSLFMAVRAHGLDTLVVQWTRYGDAFADEDERAWLQARIDDARAQGLRVVLGLEADPEFFQRQQQSGAALEHYLQRQSRNNLRTAQAWLKRLGPEAIAAWYLPLEIDDHRWRDTQARALLYAHLEAQRRDLQQVLERPVYVSSFFAGNMTPQRYRELVEGMAASGMRVWVQDGAGTGRLLDTERHLYLSALGDCGDRPVAGVIHELFHQLGDDTHFQAEPVDQAEAARRLAQPAACGDRVFFELRYLPDARDVLAR